MSSNGYHQLNRHHNLSATHPMPLLLRSLLLLLAGTTAAGTAAAAADVAGSSKRGRDEPAPYISTPMCACGAGPCNIMKEAGSWRMYFACPDDVSSSAFVVC
jgi:hypothetical protein